MLGDPGQVAAVRDGGRRRALAGGARLAGTWTEGALTWANQPATTGSAVTAASGAGWREWTVTSQVAAMYSGTNHGFVVRDSTGVALLAPEQVFSSRTAASDHPELVLTLG